MSAKKKAELREEQVREKISRLQEYYCRYCAEGNSAEHIEKCKICSIGEWITGLINVLKARK